MVNRCREFTERCNIETLQLERGLQMVWTSEMYKVHLSQNSHFVRYAKTLVVVLKENVIQLKSESSHFEGDIKCSIVDRMGISISEAKTFLLFIFDKSSELLKPLSGFFHQLGENFLFIHTKGSRRKSPYHDNTCPLCYLFLFWWKLKKISLKVILIFLPK